MDGGEMNPPQVLAAGSKRLFAKKTEKLLWEEECGTEPYDSRLNIHGVPFSWLCTACEHSFSLSL